MSDFGAVVLLVGMALVCELLVAANQAARAWREHQEGLRDEVEQHAVRQARNSGSPLLQGGDKGVVRGEPVQSQAPGVDGLELARDGFATARVTVSGPPLNPLLEGGESVGPSTLRPFDRLRAQGSGPTGAEPRCPRRYGRS